MKTLSSPCKAPHSRTRSHRLTANVHSFNQLINISDRTAAVICVNSKILVYLRSIKITLPQALVTKLRNGAYCEESTDTGSIQKIIFNPKN